MRTLIYAGHIMDYLDDIMQPYHLLHPSCAHFIAETQVRLFFDKKRIVDHLVGYVATLLGLSDMAGDHDPEVLIETLKEYERLHYITKDFLETKIRSIGRFTELVSKLENTSCPQ